MRRIRRFISIFEILQGVSDLLYLAISRCLRQHEMEMPSRAIAYSPDGSRIAVGFGLPVKKSVKQFDGKWSLLQEDDFQVNVRVSATWCRG